MRNLQTVFIQLAVTYVTLHPTVFITRGIYARKFPPQCIPAQSLTHILYAFADVRPDSGEVFLTDAWADEQVSYVDIAIAVPGSVGVGSEAMSEYSDLFLLGSWRTQIHYEGDSWNDQGTNLYGNFKQYVPSLPIVRGTHQRAHFRSLPSIAGSTF